MKRLEQLAAIRHTPTNMLAEWKVPVLLAFLVLTLTTIPYLVGWATSTPELTFGGLILTVDDGHSHLAKMQQGYRGAWQYHILFTPEPHKGAFTNLFYLALGHLARLTNLGVMVTYHAMRLTCGLLFLLSAYQFAASFIHGRVTRRLSYLFISFSSGLGWLAVLITGSIKPGGITPVDFWLIEMYTFFTVMTYPHASLAIALLLLIFLLALHYTREYGWQYIVGAVLAALGLSLIHPYMLLTVDLVLAGYWLFVSVSHRRLWLSPIPGLALLGLAPVPLAIAQYLSLANNPVMSAWQAQSTTFSPPPWYYALGYGILLLLALPGGWWALRQRERLPLIPVWLLTIIPLLYVPLIFNLERRFIEGAHVPISILAALGFIHVVQPKLRRSQAAQFLSQRFGYRPQRFTAFVKSFLFALTLPSTILLLINAIPAPVQDTSDYFYTRNEIAAMTWLESHSSPDATVLASYEIGGRIPAATGRRTVMGHWAETLDLEKKRIATEAFFDDASPARRKELLTNYGVDYVFYGPREREMGGFEPAEANYLTLVFERGDVQLYRVLDAQL